eukprot:1847198-Rhodomonas_salina.1
MVRQHPLLAARAGRGLKLPFKARRDPIPIVLDQLVDRHREASRAFHRERDVVVGDLAAQEEVRVVLEDVLHPAVLVPPHRHPVAAAALDDDVHGVAVVVAVQDGGEGGEEGVGKAAEQLARGPVDLQQRRVRPDLRPEVLRDSGRVLHHDRSVRAVMQACSLDDGVEALAQLLDGRGQGGRGLKHHAHRLGRLCGRLLAEQQLQDAHHQREYLQLPHSLLRCQSRRRRRTEAAQAVERLDHPLGSGRSNGSDLLVLDAVHLQLLDVGRALQPRVQPQQHLLARVHAVHDAGHLHADQLDLDCVRVRRVGVLLPHLCPVLHPRRPMRRPLRLR